MIYFAVDEPQPRFVWVRIDHGHSHPCPQELVKQNIDVLRDGKIVLDATAANIALDREIDPHLIMFTPPDVAQVCPCCKDKHKYNESLRGVDEELSDTLRASILAWALHRDDHLAQKSRPMDLGPIDFRHVVDHLRLCYSEITKNVCLTLVEKDGVKGVRLNCKGDQQILGREHIEATLVPRSDLLKVQRFLLQSLIDSVCLCWSSSASRPLSGATAN